MLSYLSRWASVALSVRSLTPTSSMSAPEARTRPEEVAADTAEAVDANPDGHRFHLLVSMRRLRDAGAPMSVAWSQPAGRRGVTKLARSRRPTLAAVRRGRPCAGHRRRRFDRVRLARLRRGDAYPRRRRSRQQASMSGVTAASVSGMPRSRARLSARASRRRMRPAIASLVSGGSASAPSSSSEACRCSRRSRPARGQVVGRVVGEDLQRPGDPGRRGHRGAGRAAQVGVVEVGQPVGGRPHLAAYPPLLPGQHAVVRADAGEQRGDRVAVLDHDPVDAADLAGLGGDAEPPGGADQRQRRLRARAGDLQRAGAAGLGQRAVRQERAAPGRHRAADVGRRPRAAAGRAPGGRARRAGRSGGPAPRRP